MAVRSSPRIPPLSLGRYELSGRATHGLLGPVYRARDTDSDTLVALHLLSPELAQDAAQLERLRGEARDPSRREHPNILRVLDFGRDGEFVFVVAEWVEGTTLAKMIEAHARLPEDTAIRIVAQVGQAIDFAQKEGAGLCRVTPANVMIRNDGVAKLMPFGVTTEAVAPAPAPAAYRSAFAPPPAPVKEPERVAVLETPDAPFADLVQSLAATLHEAITGQPWEPPAPPAPPVPGRRRRSRTPPRAVGLTERTERAIRRATDADPARRPSSCAEWLKLLRSRSSASAGSKPELRSIAEADDRRAYVRYALGVGSNCTITTSLFDPPGGGPPEAQETWPLVVKDVSAGGVGILLARRWEVGTELAIELVIGPDRSPCSLPVQVVRVRRDNLGHWLHGCQFYTPLDEQELAALLNHLGRVEPV